MKNFVFVAVFLFLSGIEVDALYTSCEELRTSSNNLQPSGIYTFEDSNGQHYQTYCDMLTNGGGWTLVASIHENNIESTGYCTSGDRWSGEQGVTNTRPKGDENWENYNIFGSAVSATSDDFKNPGYFDISAQDIMVWHVPNKTPLGDWRQEAFLRYRTNSGDLAKEGGNLFSLFERYPLVSGCYEFPKDAGPAMPVVYDKGSDEEVMSHQAPFVLDQIEPGYIQFRAPNQFKDVFAMCPGVRMNPYSLGYSAYACIGSTGRNGLDNYCGDFAGYASSGVGTHYDVSVDSTLVHGAMLIFYR